MGTEHLADDELVQLLDFGPEGNNLTALESDLLRRLRARIEKDDARERTGQAELEF